MTVFITAPGTKISNPDAIQVTENELTMPNRKGWFVFRTNDSSLTDLSGSGITLAASVDTGNSISWLPEGVVVTKASGYTSNLLPTNSFSYYSVFRAFTANSFLQAFPVSNWSDYTSVGVSGDAIWERYPRGTSNEEYGTLVVYNDASALITISTAADANLARPVSGEFVFRCVVIDAVNYQYNIYTGKSGVLTKVSRGAGTDITKRDKSRYYRIGYNNTHSIPSGSSSKIVVSEAGFYITALTDRQVAKAYSDARSMAAIVGISL